MMLTVIVAITLFIFGNSLLGYNTSHNTSDAVSDLILPDAYSRDETALLIIRKAAHLIEYAALGFAVMLLAEYVSRTYGKKLYGTALFYVLFVPVLDEYIQSFSDRTSSIGDVLLDFLGALLGFALLFLMRLVCSKGKTRKPH